MALKEILKEQKEEYEKLFDKGNPESIVHFMKRYNAKIIKAVCKEMIGKIKEIPNRTGDWKGVDYDFHFDKEIGYNARVKEEIEKAKELEI